MLLKAMNPKTMMYIPQTYLITHQTATPKKKLQKNWRVLLDAINDDDDDNDGDDDNHDYLDTDRGTNCRLDVQKTLTLFCILTVALPALFPVSLIGLSRF